MNEIFIAMLDSIAQALPLIAAALVPPALAFINKWAGDTVPKHLYPILLPIAGAIVAGLSKAAGLDLGDFNPSTASLSMWETVVAGALVGHASIGVHQIKKQLYKGPDTGPDT